MNEILRFMQKRDERTDGRKAFYNLPTSAFGRRREIKCDFAQVLLLSTWAIMIHGVPVKTYNALQNHIIVLFVLLGNN